MTQPEMPPGLWRFYERVNHPVDGTPYYVFLNRAGPVNFSKYAIPVSEFWG